jgi:hypothetical protein
MFPEFSIPDPILNSFSYQTEQYCPKNVILSQILIKQRQVSGVYRLKRTWKWDVFSGVFAEIGSSWVPYTTFQAVPILASNSRRYSYSKNTPRYHLYGESPTPRISDAGSRRLPDSTIRGVGDSRITDTESRLLNFFKTPHQWYGESPTPRILESESHWLRVSPIRRVDDYAYWWFGSRYSKKKK